MNIDTETIYWAMLLVLVALSGYGIRAATSVSLAQFIETCDKWRELHASSHASLLEAAQIAGESEQQRDALIAELRAYIADQREELKRLHESLAYAKGECTTHETLLKTLLESEARLTKQLVEARAQIAFRDERFQQAINASCSCGGKGRGVGCCQACEVWHQYISECGQEKGGK